MTEYNVKFTNNNVPPIKIPELETKQVSGITLFGRINEEYGESLDQDYLNLLENFACPEVSGNDDIRLATPDIAQTSAEQLSNPVIGQIWYNSSRNTPYYWDGSIWNPIGLREDVAANWGQIMHGSQIPKPVSSITGRVFDYKDCIWTVSPSVIVGKPGYISCATDDQAVVTMKYRLVGNDSMLMGLANYIIIGVRGNDNFATRIPPIEITPTPSLSVSMTPTQTITPSITPSISPSNTPSATPQVTPTRTPQPSISRTPASTPAVTPTKTPQPTPTRTPSPSVTPPAPTGFNGPYGGLCYTRNGSGQVQYFVNFGANGSVTEGSSFAIAPIGNAGNWLGSAANTGDYQIMFQGTSPESLASNTWYSLTNGANFIWSASSNGLPVNKMISGTFSMRRVSTGVVFSTAEVQSTQLGLNVECF